MEIFDSRYYKYNKMSLSIMGLWSYQTKKQKLLGRFIISTSIASGFYFEVEFQFFDIFLVFYKKVALISRFYNVEII